MTDTPAALRFAMRLKEPPKATVPAAWAAAEVDERAAEAEAEVERVARRYEELAQPLKQQQQHARADGAGGAASAAAAVDAAAADRDEVDEVEEVELVAVRRVRSLHGGELVEVSLPPWADDDGGARLALDDGRRWRQGPRPRRLATASRVPPRVPSARPLGAIASSPPKDAGSTTSSTMSLVYRALQLMFRSGFFAVLALLGSLLTMRSKEPPKAATVPAAWATAQSSSPPAPAPRPRRRAK